MPYEVVKRAGSDRAYRYEVTSYRDPVTGKVKGNWKYLGRVGKDGVARKEREPARVRLADALQALLQHRSVGAITVSQIASQAGMSHATFYRHFKDKGEAFLAVLTRASAENNAVPEDVSASPEQERMKLRALIVAHLSQRALNNGVIRSLLEWSSRDRRVATFVLRRDAARRTTMAQFIQRLQEQGVARDDVNPATVAELVVSLLRARVAEAALSGTVLAPHEVDATAAVVERMIFG